MRRLDSAFSTVSNKWLLYIFLVAMWGIAIKGLTADAIHRERVMPLIYILPPFSVISLWWMSSFKKVTLARDTLIVSGFWREARIPVSQIEKIHECPWGKGMEHITIKFKSETEFGRRVRFMAGTWGKDFDKVVKLLRDAMDGRITAAKINHVSRESAPTPHQHEKEIIVRGWTDEELSAILTDFADMYSDDLGKRFDYELCPRDEDATRVTFPHDIPAEQFSFLINYLNYPKNYDLKTRSISVVGKAVLSQHFHLPSKSLVGTKAVFYVPLNDEDYDLVYVHAGGETFENSFAALHWKKVEDPRIPTGVDVHDA